MRINENLSAINAIAIVHNIRIQHYVITGTWLGKTRRDMLFGKRHIMCYDSPMSHLD